MTDKEKLDAIRVEIHKLVHVNGYSKEMANELFAFINSLPEEPVSKDLLGIAMELEETIGTSPHSRLAIVEHLAKAANWQKKKTIKWLTDFNNEHVIISYTDSHSLETDELIECFKNYIED